MAEGEIYWRVIEPIWDEISIYDGPEVFLRQFRSVEPKRGNLFAAHWCYSEICNGGFDQFFSNSTGVLAPEAAAGFRAIGMGATANLIEQAMSLLGERYPRDRETREAALDAVHTNAGQDQDPFVAMDDQFFELTESEAGGFGHAADAYASTIV